MIRSTGALRRFGVVIAIVAVVAAACSDDGADSTTPPSPSTTSTTSIQSDTTTTLSPAESTTTTAAETTTTAEETTTTAAETTSTTAASSDVELSDEGIQAGATWVPFGTIDEDAIAAVTVVLGAPSEDSGWVDAFSVYGTCPGPVVRGVHWDAYVMLFTQADTDFWTGGVPHFFAWYYTDVPPDLATTEGLVIGDTLATVEALYGGPKLEINEDPFDPSGGIWLYDMVGFTGMWGFANGLEPDSVISSINGGRGCGE